MCSRSFSLISSFTLSSGQAAKGFISSSFSGTSLLAKAQSPVKPTFRTFRPCQPVAMGRRAAKIATRKTAQDARKSKVYGKIGKQIISAVKKGGPSPSGNASLALALQQAKLYDVPKDIIERNIKKASEKGQADFTPATYEVYGFGGVGIVVEALTDNLSRSAAMVRDVVKKGKAKMADPGSVTFNFTRCGVISVRVNNASSGVEPGTSLNGNTSLTDLDALMEAAMDFGADDVIEPEEKSEGEEEEVEDDPVFRVLASLDSFSPLKSKLTEMGFLVDEERCGLEYVPNTWIEPDEEAHDLNSEIISKLLELDDVDEVYSNQR